MNTAGTFLAAYETPRPARLAPNLFAACFPLMKLIPARFMIARARASGRLAPGGHIVETTSGTFGLALAMVAAAHDYRLTIISAKTLVDRTLRCRLKLLGARLDIVDDPEGSGAQSRRLERLQAIRTEHAGTFWPGQYDNPESCLAYGRLAEWFVRQVGHVDCLVGCAGSGGSLCGTAAILRQVFPELVVIAVDTPRSVLFGHTPGRRLLRGLGNSILPRNLDHQLVDEVHWVGALPAFAATHQLSRDHALFMGPTSGAAALVGQWYARRHPRAITVVILPDEGFRYQETAFNNDWLATLEGWPITIADAPETLAKIAPGGEESWTRMIWGRRVLQEVPSADDALANRECRPTAIC
ncbi:pyridoxal-phosphate dependent enzyme [Bradyrhizobium septentrionale]|uniref:Pyridoxal-phosphate dependent enzyme n=1 Tax=Bradyrhizobium septentrionale TaxID=1404411 RepID=A0A973W6D7_9BRAD|nr:MULTISPECIES: pyridoxal-phosphate dependent enzyme [Bradyrhizobium]UGY16853.1 pyridoxal-phosphate dependent enzyme [Bradyrhizobium septentrionale]